MPNPAELVTEFFNHADAVQVEDGTWYYSDSSVEAELLNVYTQLAKANERVAELERSRETAYEKWQAKYQRLKDSTRLTNCYECDAPVHELSPRSRCCNCEYRRAQFNEKENEQLRSGDRDQ